MHQETEPPVPPESLHAMHAQLHEVTVQIQAMSTLFQSLQGQVEQLQSAQAHSERPHSVSAITVQDDRNAALLKQIFNLSRNIGGMQSVLSIDNLRHELRQWNLAASPESRALIAKNIHHNYVRSCSLLVSDMSGFTRITKEEGIGQFLMLTKQMQAMCIPLMESFGGTLVKVEADNLFVIFPSPHLAVLASMHCQASTRKSNKEKRKNDQLHLSMSVVHGDLFLIPGVDLFGGVVSMGFELGEDVADKDETLVTEEVMHVCKQQAVIDGLVKFERADPFAHGGKEIGVYRAVPVLERILPFVTNCSMPVLNPQVNSAEPVEYLALMDERMQNPSKAAQIDSQLKTRFTERSTVLVIDLHFDKLTDENKKDADLVLLDSIVKLKSEAARLCKKHFGQTVASMQTRASPCIFALFSTSAAAFSAAVDFAAICCASSTGVTSCGKCSPSFGLAVGDVLNLGFCNAFGDPINVAFKLGEDVAEPLQLLVHADVIADIDAHAERHGQPLSEWDLQPASTLVSGVTLSYKVLKLGFGDPKLAQLASEMCAANVERQRSVQFLPREMHKKKVNFIEQSKHMFSTRAHLKTSMLVTLWKPSDGSMKKSPNSRSPASRSFVGRLTAEAGTHLPKWPKELKRTGLARSESPVSMYQKDATLNGGFDDVLQHVSGSG